MPGEQNGSQRTLHCSITQHITLRLYCTINCTEYEIKMILLYEIVYIFVMCMLFGLKQVSVSFGVNFVQAGWLCSLDFFSVSAAVCLRRAKTDGTHLK